MADCESARQYVNDFLKDEGLDQYVPADQVKELVSACCDDVGSQQCVNAMAAVAATGACIAATEGTCVACCSVAGRLLGPIVGESLGSAWKVIEGVWSAISGWFGGGECDYNPPGGALVAGYAKAMREVGSGLQSAWDQSRMELGLEPKQPLFVEGPGGFWTPVTLTKEKIMLHMGSLISSSWQDALLHNAIKWSKRYGPPHFTFKVAGKDDRIYSPPVGTDYTGTPENFFYFTWEDFDCSESGNWKKGAKQVADIRMGFVEGAAAWMLQKMVVALSQEAEADNVVRIRELASKMKLKPSSPIISRVKATDDGLSGAAVAAIVVVGLGLGYAAYRYRDEILGG